MKVKFNITRMTAFLLVLAVILVLFVQDLQTVIWASEEAENGQKEAAKDAISIQNGAAGDDGPAWQVGESAYDSFSAAYEAIENGEAGKDGALIVLISDVTIDETIMIDSTISLDLNGHVLSRGATDPTTDSLIEENNSNVITVGTGGDLTIFDSNRKAVHSGNTGDDGLWRFTADGSGETELTGGVITGGSAITTGGGIVINGGGRLTMTGGTIAGNRSLTYSGGGLRVDLGSAKLTDVNVFYNTAVNGGGIYSAGTLSADGGSISHNAAAGDGEGVGVWGGTTTLKNVSIDASQSAVYVMNDNSQLYIKGADTKICGTVKASTNVSERIHLSNKLRWNGCTVEAVEQKAAGSVGNILAAEQIAAGRVLDLIAAGSDMMIGTDVFTKGIRTTGNIVTTSAAACAGDFVQAMRTQIHKLLARPPSIAKWLKSMLPRLPSQITEQCPIALTAAFGYNICIDSA